jgi:phosphatidylglycerophosphate synthase
MTVRIWIDGCGDPGLVLFGMGLIERHLRALAGVSRSISEIRVSQRPDRPQPAVPQDALQPFRLDWVAEEGPAPARLAAYLTQGSDPVIAFPADTTIDTRLLEWLPGQGGNRIARSEAGNEAPAVLRLDPAAAPLIAGAGSLAEAASRLLSEGLASVVTAEEFPSFIAALRRDLPFYVHPVRTEEDRKRIERFLFWASYKGSTDFLTKWVFPPLVWLAVPPLARRRVHPHWVTLVSVIATIAAIPFFWIGAWVPGLVLAYLMAVLDSVDGKLARLTYTSSEIGRRLDHGLDSIHPPFWYLAWAHGLSIPLYGTPAALVVLYILDRVAQNLYKRRFQRALHSHSPLDAALRTVISRRNPNLFIFTVGLLLGYGVLAFQIVVAWQAVTFLYHAWRTATALGTARPRTA